MNTARLLMAATILLVVAFQFYWIKKLYREEDNNFKKSADIIFREAMYRLQAERFTGDTMIFKGMPGDNLFMTDVISSIKQVRTKDSVQQKLVISMSTEEEKMSPAIINTLKKQKDTVIYVDTKEGGVPPPHIERFLEHNKTINDSIPVKRIDSLYTALLAKEGIDVPYRIIKIATPKRDSGMQFTVSIDKPGKVFATKRVPVGFLSPVFYKAEFDNTSAYVLKKMSPQLLLSLLLIALTAVSFIFIYRNLLAQKRLTEIKNEFIGNITHELKTPIATVSVAIEAMKNFDALQNPARTKEYLAIAGQELNRLSLLVDKVLRLSMFETQQVELKYEWFDMKSLVQEVSGSMQLQFEKFGAVVKLNFQGEDFSLMADRMHITSVVYNLLDNTLKYSKTNPEIEINIVAAKNEMVLTVKDNGIGIPASYKEKIFDKFFRVPHGNKHNVKGYGLGLSYVAHIIAEHKGSVTADSEEGTGTTFIIKLPKENAGS
ncbi:MAG TPA: HAMP domain-containing sensor histidine kinase [Ferruginibacter sp.]|nr:HAMP domain-containing sensor histidine kinase [Ferruginibacter sp.]